MTNINALALSYANKGVAYLDSRVSTFTELKDWRSKIKVEKLDISMGDVCVLGQLFGGYFAGLDRLGLSGLGAEDRGFIARDSYPTISSKDLTEAWKSILALPKVGQIYKDAYNDAVRVEGVVRRESDGQVTIVVTGGSIVSGAYKPSTSSMWNTALRNIQAMTLFTPPVFKDGDIIMGKRKENGSPIYMIVRKLGAYHEIAFLNAGGVTGGSLDYAEKEYGPLKQATYGTTPASVGGSFELR